MEEQRALGPLEWLRYLLFGFCMGCADLVPGVSGGTVAFIIGFYERLINTIKGFNSRVLFLLLTFRFSEFHRVYRWDFLAAILGGIAVSLLLLSHLFDWMLNVPEARSLMFAAFFGLIVASVYFCAKKVSLWTGGCAFALLVGAAAAFILTNGEWAPPSASKHYDVQLPDIGHYSNAANYDSRREMILSVPEEALQGMLIRGVVSADSLAYSVDDGSQETVRELVARQPKRLLIDPWVIFCGMITISAMLLPGISGSYLMVVMGMYPLLVGAVADFSQELRKLAFDGDSALFLSNFLFGITLGALFFSRVISWALSRYHDITIATLTGFMAGALRAIWPFWSYQMYLLPLRPEKGLQLQPIAPVAPHWDFTLFLAITAALTAIFVLLGIDWTAGKLKESSKL